MKNILGLFLILAFSAAAFGQQPKAKPLAETFSATALDGESFDLAELKGKIVVLTFWSTKCPICHSESPKLNQLAKTYQGKEIVFLGLTTENPDKVRAYLKKTPFVFDILPNSFSVLLKYADRDGDGNVAMGFPTHFLINQKGEIELKTSGFDKTETLAARINQLLNQK
jgi:peroxiredoxin